ncbi:MAG TPA: hypothetical protein V6C96_02815 [Vampirovibrionales bacterium]
MAFKYKLQKILDLREQELDKVKSEFQEAAGKVAHIQKLIKQNKESQTKTQADLFTQQGLASPHLYTNRLKFLKIQLEELEVRLEDAKRELEVVRQKLVEAQQKAEALHKHKDKLQKEHNHAELKKEEAEMNELALIMRRVKQDQERDDLK